MQVYVYIKLYPNDHWRFKALVAIIWLLDIVHTAMVCTVNWTYMIANFGDSDVFDFIPWSVGVSIVLTAFVTHIIHCFFAHRIHKLGKNWWFTVPIYILASFRLCVALVTTGHMMRLRSFLTFFDHYIWLFILGLSLSAAVDTMIAIGLCWYLHQSRTGFSSMDNIIDSITVYTVENGLITCIVTLVSLISWVTMPHNLVFLALYFTISKLYANAFLATLNARKVLRGRSQQSTDRNSEHAMPVMFPSRFSRGGAFTSRQEHDPISTKVQINVEKTIQCDDADVDIDVADFSPSDQSDIDKSDRASVKNHPQV
ncbi:hypothetical protein C8Q75DRAFT_253751 [Abortiporus biennis]|nr:hypothetical protein C8Q75DRAFT_253751 [Abortiporus biennis]